MVRGKFFLKKYLKEKKVRRVAGNIIEKIVGERGQRVILKNIKKYFKERKIRRVAGNIIQKKLSEKEGRE